MEFKDKYILDDANDPVLCSDLLQWAEWLETADHRRVRLDCADGYRVSTVFLGLDMNFGDGPPILFETMTFYGGTEHDQLRYATYDQALAGHALLLAEVKARFAGSVDAASELVTKAKAKKEP